MSTPFFSSNKNCRKQQLRGAHLNLAWRLCGFEDDIRSTDKDVIALPNDILLALTVKVGSFSCQPPIATPCRDSESRRIDASSSAIGAVKFVRNNYKQTDDEDAARKDSDVITALSPDRSAQLLHSESPQAPERAEVLSRLLHRAGTAWPRDLAISLARRPRPKARLF
jgi:hypothetical protein